jgi:3-oxosteroid 1-dehydrogenase
MLTERFKKYAKKHGIPVNTHHEVRRILRDNEGRVYGLEVVAEVKTKTYNTKKAVIFGSGGYTHNEEMLRNFQRGPVYGGCTSAECEGDFIPMAS